MLRKISSLLGRPVLWLKGLFLPGGAAPPLLEWKRKQKDSKTVIVFIHGFTGDAISTWPHFADLLGSALSLLQWDIASLRYQTSFLPDIEGVWRANAPIERLALMLHTSCTVGALADYTDFAFVAHSMGGLVVQRTLVDHSDLAQRTRYLFLFGTPSMGLAKAAPVWWWKRQLDDMAYGGPFIADLRLRWKDRFDGPDGAPFRIFAVTGENDEFVPADRSLPPFAEHQRFSIPGDHLQIVKAVEPDDPAVQLVIRGITGSAAPAGPWNAARVAIELGQFQKTISDFGPPSSWGGLDANAKVALALALESVGRETEALSLLSGSATQSTDLMGTLAGRLKRRWLLHRQREDAVKAYHCYETAYHDAANIADPASRESQSYYLAVNCAYMRLAVENDRSDAMKWASKALEHCARAPDGMWKSATLGESKLILGDQEGALRHYIDALGSGPSPRQIGSMYRQARQIAELLEQSGAVTSLDRLFRPERELG